MIDALVVGHICLDIIPALKGKVAFEPGRLIEVGDATLSTGGAVSNTGQALHKLGVKTGLCGKVGDDLFGKSIRKILDQTGHGLSDGMKISAGEATSYTIVISLSGEDRMFLHAPGCNDSFVSADVSDEALSGARLVHFGYPTLMAQMFRDNGKETVDLLKRAKALGATTSMDVSLPDLAGPAGKADWLEILAQALPYTDLFLPNVEELHFMLDRESFERRDCDDLSTEDVRRLSRKAIGMGAKVLAVKLGANGLYLASGSSFEGLGRGMPANSQDWRNLELWGPCFSVDVAGTTGAGDATVAGLLMAWLKSMSPQDAVRAANAVGACCCERHDAVTGVKPWPEIETRINSGWTSAMLTLGPAWVISHGVFTRK
jgi:sugar/nucleoside kinase (ribokinase family)